MKRVAVCLSGLPGDLENSLCQIKNTFIDPLNADLFIWFWYSENPVRRDYLPLQIYNKNSMQEKIYKIVTPITYKEIDYYTMHDEFIRLSTLNEVTCAQRYLAHIPNYFSQWYAVKEANCLKKNYEEQNNFVYDIVLRVRTEIYYERQLNYDDLKYHEKKVIIPLGYGDGNTYGAGLKSINDFMAFGSSKNIDIYSSLYDYIPQYCQETYVIHSESHVLYHLQKNKIPIHRIVFKGKIMKNGKFPFGPTWRPGVEYPGDKIAEELQ